MRGKCLPCLHARNAVRMSITPNTPGNPQCADSDSPASVDAAGNQQSLTRSPDSGTSRSCEPITCVACREETDQSLTGGCILKPLSVVKPRYSLSSVSHIHNFSASNPRVVGCEGPVVAISECRPCLDQLRAVYGYRVRVRSAHTQR